VSPITIKAERLGILYQNQYKIKNNKIAYSISRFEPMTIKRPKYGNFFEYLEEHYELISPDTPLTRFYKKDIEENQYPRLDGPVNPEKVEFKTPQEAAEVVEEFAKAAGADLVGFTEVKDYMVFEGIELDHKYAAVLAMEMDYDRIATAPGEPSGVEVLRIYWRIGAIAVKTAEFIRDMGYRALAHHPRSFTNRSPTILNPIAAIEAGLGEQGRLGLLITEEFGPRVRLATVTTELHLPQSKRKRFGVDEFCRTCHICQEACEGDAIPQEKRKIRGIEKYTIDPYRCLPYFGKYDGCNICVARCAFNLRDDELKRFVEKVNKQRINKLKKS
jgi:epoxyqueuosine reductase QueG